VKPAAGALVLVFGAVLGLAGCSSPDSAPDGSAGPTSAPPSPTKTLTMLPLPEKTLSGSLTAELQQSSRDVALGRFQVWITNGLEREVSPRRIVYRDPMLSTAVTGGRLRPIPSGSYRGYTLDLVEPSCEGSRGKRTAQATAKATATATVTVSYGAEVETLPVEDETGVVARWSSERCDEIAIEQVARLEWSPGIEVQGTGEDALALFRLTARPTGRPGGSVTIETVGGTPLFTSADGDFWTVHGRVRSDDEAVTFELPAQPARCDAHAFGAAGGGTTFFVNVTIGKQRQGQIRLAMSPEVTAEAFEYAAEACGWDE
jgi:hypothetical protein